MLISDLPLLRSGIKSSGSTREVLEEYCSQHLRLGVASIEKLKEQGSGKIQKIGGNLQGSLS